MFVFLHFSGHSPGGNMLSGPVLDDSPSGKSPAGDGTSLFISFAIAGASLGEVPPLSGAGAMSSTSSDADGASIVEVLLLLSSKHSRSFTC